MVSVIPVQSTERSPLHGDPSPGSSRDATILAKASPREAFVHPYSQREGVSHQGQVRQGWRAAQESGCQARPSSQPFFPLPLRRRLVSLLQDAGLTPRLHAQPSVARPRTLRARAGLGWFYPNPSCAQVPWSCRADALGFGLCLGRLTWAEDSGSREGPPGKAWIPPTNSLASIQNLRASSVQGPQLLSWKYLFPQGYNHFPF